jgi:hypothetical protein
LIGISSKWNRLLAVLSWLGSNENFDENLGVMQFQLRASETEGQLPSFMLQKMFSGVTENPECLRRASEATNLYTSASKQKFWKGSNTGIYFVTLYRTRKVKFAWQQIWCPPQSRTGQGQRKGTGWWFWV